MRKPVTIRRHGAIGDVIMASAIADKLHERGFDTTIACESACAVPFENHPFIKTTQKVSGDDVVLDNAYEMCDKSILKSKPTVKIFAESAFAQLLVNQSNRISDFSNLTPRLYLSNTETEKALWVLSKWPKPWIAICPKSAYWPNRTVPKHIWELAAKYDHSGTWFWTGLEDSPAGYVDLGTKKLRDLMGILGNVDLAVSIDSAPVHIAAALGTPIVTISQMVSLKFRLSEQRDWTEIDSGIGCVGCQEFKCPINKDNPPCGLISPFMIASAIESKIESEFGDSVSAVIPFYQPIKGDKEKLNRMNRCLRAVLPQVDEVVISLDKDQEASGVMTHRKIKIVPHYSKERRGFGKTCNWGIRHANGSKILILNDDLYLDPNAVHSMKSVMVDSVACVGCLLRYPSGLIQHGGMKRFQRNWVHLDYQQKQPTITKPTELECVTYACALLDRKAFYFVGGFDEKFDVYCEDADLNLKFRERGYRIIYQPEACGVHDESQTCTPMKEKLTRDSLAILESKWGWWFDANKNKEVGVFA